MEMEKKTDRKRGEKGLLGLGLVLVLVLALAIGGVSGAFGLLKDTSAGVTAEYTAHVVKCEVKAETLEDQEKTEEESLPKTVYSVSNTGTTSAYFRAAVVMNWTNGEKAVVYYPDEAFPALALAEGWVKDGEYYYFEKAVKPGDSCELFRVELPGDTAYQLQITVLADAIQSEPATAIKEAWGHSPGNK